jgi:hypothetical protein
VDSTGNITEKTGENADFERGLFVCEKPGLEFASAGSTNTLIGLVGTQAFAMMFLIPVVGFFVLRNVFGVSAIIAGVFAGVISIVVVTVGLMFLMRINKGNKKQGMYFKSESDSRYRVRVVIPKKKQDKGVLRWAQFAAGDPLGDTQDLSEDELGMIRGGFEPIVIRPWFGLRRDRWYWWTFAVMSVVVGFVAVYLLSFVFGGMMGLLKMSGFMGYALMGLAMVGGALSSELLWPVYIRLVPGQLDIFKYGLLGSGQAEVESFDLHKVGVCVDLGGYLVAIEPERPVGEPLPKMVQGKRWPHGQAFPDDYQPAYFSLALVRGRKKFSQRLIQAARTDEPTPPIMMDRLGE